MSDVIFIEPPPLLGGERAREKEKYNQRAKVELEASFKFIRSKFIRSTPERVKKKQSSLDSIVSSLSRSFTHRPNAQEFIFSFFNLAQRETETETEASRDDLRLFPRSMSQVASSNDYESQRAQRIASNRHKVRDFYACLR